MTTTDPRWQDVKVGDVIEDAYANPAVVLSLATPSPTASFHVTVMQTVGSDRGHITSPGLWLRHVTDSRREWALEVAREEWRKQGLKRSNFNLR